MTARPAPLRIWHIGRGWLRISGIGLAVALAAAGGAAMAQGTGGAAVSAPQQQPAADAPVIAAPDAPGRMAPGNGFLESTGGAGFNSFAATDAALPPLENFAPETLPVVVELFTSQGCSSCPPVDAMLARLTDEPGVLPLSFHVDYWDYLGWRDSFARPEFSQRQERYARAAGERGLYTPQLIVDGTDTAVAPGPAQLMALIDSSRLAPAMVSVQRDSIADGERIELQPLSDLGGQVDILMIRYAPERRVEVTGGENRGRSISYANVVLAVERLAQWEGKQPLRMTVRPDDASGARFPADTRHVLIVQRDLSARDHLPGPILAAIPLD
ncbi:DUF1223 domain-containing protein [Paracoccus spongiarum]|uniref:DUF1223 domain-containing protein n=1 Tax=Paracoccus spongiarum TaxID=3064387 RepID=A0ABT9J6X7_9RHOB|nr:DUF1223 domain-containing protein [Paracoccus sp. 2205BS29-5]MDP5305559.1 DUF1223 domain-containing protein [Paracoccus sp. 2205BS29-5]